MAGHAEGANPYEQAQALLAGVGDEAGGRIAALEEQRRRLAAERKEVLRTLRNEQRKRKRLIEKAKTLTNSDLMEVLGARAAAKAKAVAKAKAKAKAAA